MNSSSILVSGVVLLLLIILITFMLDLFIPINKKFQFDSICSQYVFICDNNNGLSVHQKGQLVDELTQIGLTNISYSIPAVNEKVFNEEYLFQVQGEFVFNRLVSFIKRQHKIISMNYQYKLINRQVIN